MKKKQSLTPSNQIKVIRKANELVEARYRFDLWEMRVFAKMLMSIRSEDKDLHRYNIHINEIIKDFNLHDKGDNYAAIKEAANKLLSKVIEIEKVTPEGVKWFRAPLLIGVEGFNDRRDGNYISVQFHPDLKPFLLELKERYLTYDIRNLWGLSSVYSVRMYELLKQYEKIGKRHFAIDDLRLILGILPEEYKLYGHFKSKIILKAQSDLNESTDILFEYEEQKQGKRVVGITFQIRKNSRDRLLLEEKYTPTNTNTQAVGEEKSEEIDNIFVKKTFEIVKSWGISVATLRSLINDFGEERVSSGLEYTSEAIEKGKIKGNPAGFFCKAVEEAWQSSTQLQKKQIEQKKKEAAQKREELSAEEAIWKNRLDDLLESRRNDANEIVRIRTQEDTNLAAEAVSLIKKDRILCNILERKTDLKIDKLSMDDWRHNPELREAVLIKIEYMFPEDFSTVQKEYDLLIKKARNKIKDIQALLQDLL